MLDTTRLTFQGLSPDCLKRHDDGEQWMLQTFDDGSMSTQYVTKLLNKSQDGKHYNGTLRISYDHKHRYLNVSVSSLPAMIYGTSFETLKHQDMKLIRQELEKYVHPYVDVDINTGIFSRLDNSLLYAMDKSPASYICLLDEITRSKQFRMNKTYYQGQTLQFRNRQITLAVYDKFMKNRNNDVELRFLNSCDFAGKQNMLRFEVQNKTAKAVRHLFGKDVTLKDIESDYFVSKLHEQRIKLFRKHFRFTHGERKELFEDFLKTYLHMEQHNERFALDKALWTLVLQNDIVSLELIEKTLQIAGKSRQHIHKRMKGLKELMSTDVEKVELFEELRRKVEDIAA